MLYLRGGGGGDKGYFFVKLDFEIAVDQQTRTGDPTFGPGLRPPTGARGAAVGGGSPGPPQKLGHQS